MIRKALIAATLVAFSAGAIAAVSSDQASQLGKTLTPVGAEKAGNKDGTIPAWEGGLTTAPSSYKAGSGVRPDPYAADKPRLQITGKNADEYKAQLTGITYALLKRYPTMRVDVYPTRRPVVYPKKIVENTLKNATQAKTTEGGLAFENALPGYPFPVPTTGNEVMWNHLMRYPGEATFCKYDSYNIDSAGVATLSTSGNSYQEFPIFAAKHLDTPLQSNEPFWFIKQEYTAPARRAGEALIIYDHVNPLAQPRKAWQYLPGQRRVKLAPDIAYDTPNPAVAGAATYDDAFVFNGAMDRFDFKLLGKREMFVPYNSYKGVYAPGDKKNVTTPNHFNPDLIRWELHRVWVVEATLKSGKRHIYHKRQFYVDEDSWVALASDEYDARGQLYRGILAPTAFAYDSQVLNTNLQIAYDLVAGMYGSQGNCGLYQGLVYRGPYAARDWSPGLAGGCRYSLIQRGVPGDPCVGHPATDIHSRTGLELVAVRVWGETMQGPKSRMLVLVSAAACVGIACAAATADAPSTKGPVDVLERPAMKSPVAAQRLMLAVKRIGDRLVAVGPRGHIVVSTDAGATWQQSDVPVSSDLTAVSFPSLKRGWAVGHDGVVLATTDGGLSWTKQIDGRAVNDIILADVKAKLAAKPESAELQALVAEAERYKKDGPDKPFLDVWFENDTTGYVVGAYGLLLKTTDGGKTWQSWFDRAENPRFMNLYSIRPAGGTLFIAGEAGTVLKLDAATERFKAVPVDYVGSLFGIAAVSDAVLVYGLRGNAFRTVDGGTTWTKVDARLPATIVSSTTVLPRNVVLADQGGRLAVSNDGGVSFELLPLRRSLPLTSIDYAGAGRIAATGPFGVMVVAPDAPAAP